MTNDYWVCNYTAFSFRKVCPNYSLLLYILYHLLHFTVTAHLILAHEPDLDIRKKVLTTLNTLLVCIVDINHYWLPHSICKGQLIEFFL